ncbi:MAG: hypothetical protein MJ010_06200 [Paludibacteraceae bacterium]|nr:hypothetical protein [Paludibacteraceae bacterium]
MENKISKISMWVLFGITIIVAALFYLGGYVDVNAEYPEPIFTEQLMWLMYAFVAIAALLVLVAAIANIAMDFRKNPKSAIKSICGVGALILVMIISYCVSSGDAVNVLGLEEEVSTDTLKMVDMQLYTIYVLLVVGIILMICSNFAKKLK